MKKLKKRAAIELSITGIVVLILAIAFLGLGLWFIKGMFGKTAVSFDEQISREPEPAAADASTPVTLSREIIKSNPGKDEIIKVNIFNPTSKDWTFRDAVTLEEALCGIRGDGICFINRSNTKCDEKIEDADCKDYNCKRNSELGEGKGCVIVIGDYSEFCPGGDAECDCSADGGIGKDPDCDPTEGVRLKIDCSDGLKLEKVTNPKEIKSGTSTQFSALLGISKTQKKGSYLCKIGVEGFVEESEKYVKDLVINIA